MCLVTNSWVLLVGAVLLKVVGALFVVDGGCGLGENLLNVSLFEQKEEREERRKRNTATNMQRLFHLYPQLYRWN